MTPVREPSAIPRAPFDREPHGSLDEDGDFAFVDVTATTDTADKARDYLVANASEVLYIHNGEAKVRPEHIELRDLGVTMQWTGLLPSVWDVERLVREGLAEAWWRFDVSLASEPLPGAVAEAKRWHANFDAEQRRKAVEWRGPWWWRLRCRVSDLLGEAHARCEPSDRSSVHLRDEAAHRITIVQVRRPKQPERSLVSGASRR
jgi:hypothetical protein